MFHNLVDSVAFKIVSIVKVFDSNKLLKSSPRLLSLFNKIGLRGTAHDNGRRKRVGRCRNDEFGRKLRVGVGGRHKGLGERGEVGRKGINV